MICTSIEQSKELLRLGLPAESADMYYDVLSGINADPIVGKSRMEYTTPAWSLSALLEVIKSVFAYTTIAISGANKNFNFIRSKDLNYIWQHDIYGKTPLDAAYQMVCWLLEQGITKKGE